MRIAGFLFVPASVTVTTGTKVTWTNEDFVPHTVTDRGGAFDSSTLFNEGRYSRVFTEAGAYNYYCAIHPTMQATLTVTGPPVRVSPSPGPTATP